ncbi:hypothetical protein GCM10009865_22610 [Aeromicrobium ponti]
MQSYFDSDISCGSLDRLPFKYKPPRVNSGDLRTPVRFYEFAPNDGPEPGENEKRLLVGI